MGVVTSDGDIKTTITKEQYYAGLGLYIITLKRNKEMEDLRCELNKILESPTVDNYEDWISDWIWGYNNIGTLEEFDRLLEKIELELEE